MAGAKPYRRVLRGEQEGLAGAAFLWALNRVLRPSDFAAVKSPSPQAVETWAVKRRINCAAVRAAATDVARLRMAWRARFGRIPRNLQGLLRFSSAYSGPAMPGPWREELARLNALPMWAGPFSDLIGLFEPPQGTTRTAPHAARPGPQDEKVEADARQALKKAQDWALGDPRADPRGAPRVDTRLLAPVGYDPLTESESHLLVRVSLFARARQRRCDEILARAGVATHAATLRPEIDRHAEWLARHLVQGETWPQIARRPGEEPHAVEMACRRLAHQLGLTLPGARRGRPRRQ